MKRSSIESIRVAVLLGIGSIGSIGCNVAWDEASSTADHSRHETTVSASDDDAVARIESRVLLRGTRDDFRGFGGCRGYPSNAVDNDSFPELALLWSGIDAYRAGDTERAIAKWQSVISEYSGTAAWNPAILNSGRVLQRCGRNYEAIEVLKILLADTSNYEKLDLPTGGFGSVSYNNDWHDACVLISESYEAVGDFRSALEYTVLARGKFRHRDMCGVAAISIDNQLRDRIANLETQIRQAQD